VNTGVLGQPDPVNYDFEFYAHGPRGAGSASKNWERFDIPRHARFIDVFALGAGGGGGGGFTRIAGAAGGGGGGGGSAAWFRGRWPVAVLAWLFERQGEGR
jgi:hypothetical protein